MVDRIIGLDIRWADKFRLYVLRSSLFVILFFSLFALRIFD